jgi:hypothetical protein
MEAVQSTSAVKELLQGGPGEVSLPGSAWDIIDQVQELDKHWDGTFLFQDSPLYEGRLLSRQHVDIISIVSSIRGTHETSLVGNGQTLTYSTGLNHVRLSCISHTKSTHAEDRERKRTTQRYVEGLNERCGCILNLVWTKIGQAHAWVVGKFVKHHSGHPKPQQEVAKLSEEQRKQFGDEMVDAGLSASQVWTTSS